MPFTPVSASYVAAANTRFAGVGLAQLQSKADSAVRSSSPGPFFDRQGALLVPCARYACT
jgi:hypothetical protein